MPEETTATADTTASTADTTQAGIIDTAASAATTATGFANDKGEFTEGWLGRIEGISPEVQAGMMKFKDIPTLVKSYGELERTLGQKGNMVAIPGKDAKPEVISAYRKALGIPEDPAHYTFQPDTMPEGVKWDEKAMEGFKEIGLKHNIPPAALKELATAHAQLEAQRGMAVAQQLEARDREQKTELGKAWGAADFEKNSLRVKAAATLVGYDPTQFHDAKTIVAFNRLASMISDDTLKMGEAASTFMNSKGLADDIIKNPQNPDHAKYHAGDEGVLKKVQDLYSVK